MGIAYVAVLTAIYAGNGPPPVLWDRLPAVTFWLLPLAVGAPVIIRAVTAPGERADSAPHMARPGNWRLLGE
jgi:hypothetical protein